MNDLAAYRLSDAEERLKVAKLLLDSEMYKDSINRSYYAIFSSIRAVLATRQIDFKKHSAVIAYFQKEFIKTGIFDHKYSRYITIAFQIRNSNDYDDFYIASKEKAAEQYERATELYEAVKQYLQTE